MSKPRVADRSRQVLSPALWIAAATWIVLGLSAGTASAAPHKIDICKNGKTLNVDVHAVPALLEQGARLGSCDGGGSCACSQEFDPVTCTNGKTYANECLATCDGQSGCDRLAVCSNIWNPVSCTAPDGSTHVYANRCQAENAGATGCNVLCACPQDYAPVQCGNGKIYVNACVAQCDGQTGCTPL
jgi:hypothetical protein